MISYILPTRNRPDRLAETLAALGRLSGDDHAAVGGAAVIVVDNASDPPVDPPRKLSNGLPVETIRLRANEGAAARNRAARRAAGEWLVMLDDDSFPLDTAFLEVLAGLPGDVAALGADITLPNGRREDGGLPEVFVGCGAAVRRRAFLDAGGFDPAFHFYAEEYDLCAKLILAGWRVMHDLRFRVLHRKVAEGRDRDQILRCLVRNNGWVMQRYAPRHRRREEIAEVLMRYARIALREHAAAGYAAGVKEFFETCARQPSREMSEELFDRFTGLAQARAALGSCDEIGPGVRAALVDEGKNAHVVRRALCEMGAQLVDDDRRADVLVIGTLSPGPLLDADGGGGRDARPVLEPWRLMDGGVCVEGAVVAGSRRR